MASTLRWIGNGPWTRAGLLAVFGLLTLSSLAREASADDAGLGSPPVTIATGPSKTPIKDGFGEETTWAVLRIPGDYRLPEPNERVVVPVPAGAIVQFGSTFDPNRTFIDVQDVDLVLTLETGGELVLRDFFATVDPSATIVFGRGRVLSADSFLARLTALAQLRGPSSRFSLSELTAEIEPGAPGGGEMFGLLHVVSWLLERMDLASESQASEPQRAALTAEMPLLQQLLAQLLILQEAQIAMLAEKYEMTMGHVLAAVSQRLEMGAGSRADIAQAKSWHLDAQLEAREAEFRHILAVDAHQDKFGERLERAATPVWKTVPPDDLSAITAQVTPEKRGMARRYWRQLRFAKDTLPLLETLTAVVEEIREAYRMQYEVGQRTLLDVGKAEKNRLRDSRSPSAAPNRKAAC